MKHEREWWVKVNLDDLSDSLDRLDSTEERGQWVEGFRIGSRGHESREGWTPFKTIGFDFGVECLGEAKKFRLSQSEKGLKSAAARNRSSTGSQPDYQPEVNRSSTEVQPNTQPEPNRSSTGSQPCKPSNSTEVQPEVNRSSTEPHYFNRSSTEVQPDGQPNTNQPTATNQQPTVNNQNPKTTPQAPHGDEDFPDQEIRELNDRRREREEDANDHLDLIPQVMAFQGFAPVWQRWCRANRERRTPITRSVAEAQLEMLANHSPEVAKTMIVTSIEKNWKSLIPPASKEAPAKTAREMPEWMFEKLKKAKDALFALEKAQKRINPATHPSSWKDGLKAIERAKGDVAELEK